MKNFDNLLSISPLSISQIDYIVNNAKKYYKNRSLYSYLKGKTVANLFFEPSTRTKSSFLLAQKRLGAISLELGAKTSSTVKGETLVDTAQTINSLGVDIAVIRHLYAGACTILTQHMDAKVVNAGDGKHAHPTQALLDLFILSRHFNSYFNTKLAPSKVLKNKTIGIIGDVSHSRVSNSLCEAFTKLGANIVIIAPPVFVPKDIDKVWPKSLTVETDFDKVLPSLDVCYMLRIQNERMENKNAPDINDYITHYSMNKTRLSNLQKHSVILHPGPVNRGIEMQSEIVDSKRCLIRNQVSSGIAVRSSVLELLAERSK
jgi:aspartate carbamoyltransferase catalytic subunit